MQPPPPTSAQSRPAIASGFAFVLGVSLSALPAIGPFVAVLFVFARRWSLRRSDALWGVAAVLFAVPSAIDGTAPATLTALGTVIGPWIVFRTFHELRRSDASRGLGRPMASGLLLGYIAIVAFGLASSLAAVRPEGALTVLSAFAWHRSPAMYGHVVLTVGALIAVFTRDHARVALSALGLAAIGVLVSGSLEAAIAWLVVALGTIVWNAGHSRVRRAIEAAAIAAIAIAALLSAPALGWGRIGFLLAGDAVRPTANLLAGTEIPDGDWWDDHWVSVRSESIRLAGQNMRAYEVTKLGSEPWYRLQQRLVLSPGAPYTLSGWIDTSTATETGVVPGFQGYGIPTTANDEPPPRPLIVDGRWRDDTWSATLTGPGRMLDAAVMQRDGPWQRVTVTFAVDPGIAEVPWHVGFTPNAQDELGGTSRVAGMMLERASEAGAYVPGSASTGLTFGYARAPLWSAAWEAIQRRPWLGHGTGSFATTYASTRPGIDRQELVPAHPHNLFLTTWYERGVVGLLGLVALVAAMFGGAVRRPDVELLTVATAVLVLNTFDSTLLAGGVLYPLAAASGWRSASSGAGGDARPTGVRSLLARLALAAGDTGAAFGGLALASAWAATRGTGFEWTAPLVYVAMTWPALSYREGLYPGYGLTPAQELKKQMSAWFLAAVLVALGVLLFPAAIDLPLGALAVWLAATLLGMTVARSAAKRALRSLGVWGRPVVVLGAGRTGRRIARALRRSSLDGLEPVAFFDDDPNLIDRDVEGLPVVGALVAAPEFAKSAGIQHAIVAIPSLEWGRLDHLITGHSRVFRNVQFIPRLGSLPTEDVVASDLDGMLALEVRNGLYSPVNRVAKRLSDLVLTAFGSIVVAPLLAVLWLLVRLGSPGDGFYVSERIGEGGRTFRCWKFRTMYDDAEARLRELLDQDRALRRQYDLWHKLDHDPRVTPLGRFLRRTSLDELPQVFNVLRGEMSLVGPRPYLAREVPDMGRHADIIFQARPGITGHWQVTARNTVTFEDRLEMEAHYVRNWSIWWDAILLVQTPWTVVSGKGEAK